MRRGKQGKKGKPMAFLNSKLVLKKAVSPVILLGCSTMAGLPGGFTLPLQAVKIISSLAQTEFSDKHACERLHWSRKVIIICSVFFSLLTTNNTFFFL